MTTTNRSNAVAAWFMPEATYGTDPGIVTAASVDGATEAVKYQPQATGTALRAYMRLTAPPEGLPKRPLVEVEQVFPTNDYDTFRAKGLRGGQEFSFSMNLTGGVLDSGSVNDTDRPVPPPWLALAESASGRCFGHTAAAPVHGGGNLVGTNATKVAATPTANYFDIVLETGTVGVPAPGLVFGVDFGTGTATPDIELVRCTAIGNVPTEFGEPDATIAYGAVYNGSAMGFSAVPAENDIVYWPAQVAFDRRYESASPSYTFLFMRPDVDTAYLCTGCKCKEFEIANKFGEIPTVKFTFVCKDAIPFSEGGTGSFGGTPTIVDEPDYYSNWPCAKVTADDEITFLGKSTALACTTPLSGSTITSAAHGLVVGSRVVVSAIAGSTWSAGVSGDTMYVTAIATNTFELSMTPGGAAVTFSIGTGTCTVTLQPINRGLAVSDMAIKWSAGYTARHSNMAAEGTEDVRLTEKQDLTVSFTCLYRDEWRDLLGACYVVDGTYGTFPLLYWSGEKRSQIWAFAAAALALKDDPGLDGDFEGNQAHTVTLGARRYTGDTGAFAATTLVDTKWALLTM